jgi:endonuclease YncB( thermonuclease family)
MHRFLLGLLLLLLPALTLANVISGRVVGVSDGDTVTLLTPDKRQLKLRLAEIDTPERRQPYGSRARQALADKVFGKQARVEVQTIDRYGRSVGRLYLDGRDINAEMVAEGHAWAYRRYSNDPKLLTLETRAREAGRGLWGLPEFERIPPWEWRQAQRRQAASAPRSTDRKPSTCGSKRYCSQMRSCEEAKFFLQACGVTSLDGDGVPCEAVCGGM